MHFGKRPPRTHAITELLNLSSEMRMTDLQNELITLDDFYIPACYPDALPGMLPDRLPREDDAETALDLARITLQQVKQILDVN